MKIWKNIIISALVLLYSHNSYSDANKTLRTIPNNVYYCGFSCANEVYPYAKLSQGTYAANDLSSWEFWGRGRVDSNWLSGYRASIYVNDARREVVIAYSGTEFYSLGDDITDLGQYFGVLPRQYYEGVVTALDVINIVKAYNKSNNDSYSITLTGHSLGGGIAQFVAGALDQKAITFNPAPISNGVALTMAKVNDYIHQNNIPSILGNRSITNIVSRDEDNSVVHNLG